MTATPTREHAEQGRQAENAWRILSLLTLANILNFFDRTLPAVLVEPMKKDFGINDAQIGLISAVFVVVYGIAGIWIGRMADRGSRRKIMGVGLILWSLLTAASGGAWSFISLLVIRMGVGIGEATYAPASNSVIADLFPAHRRSRAVSIFQLGVPVGMMLAFFAAGAIAELFGSWRAAFYAAAVPGLILGVFLLRIDEPRRGASEPSGRSDQAEPTSTLTALKTVLAVPTIRWLTLCGIGAQFGAYSTSTFLVPLLMRHFDLPLTKAGLAAGLVLGLTGVVGLIAAGWVTDRAARRNLRGRVLVGAVALALSVPLTFFAVRQSPGSVGIFIALFSLGWLLQYAYHTSSLPAVSDVIEPHLRSTAIAILFAAFYLFGGAFGPVVAGALSDHFATAAGDSPNAAAEGLQRSLMFVIPLSMAVAAIGFFGASRTIVKDSARMKEAAAARSHDVQS